MLLFFLRSTENSQSTSIVLALTASAAREMGAARQSRGKCLPIDGKRRHKFAQRSIRKKGWVSKTPAADNSAYAKREAEATMR